MGRIMNKTEKEVRSSLRRMYEEYHEYIVVCKNLGVEPFSFGSITEWFTHFRELLENKKEQ